MLKYLEDKYGDRATCGDKSTLQFMRSEANRLEGLVQEKKEKDAEKSAEERSEKGSEDETDEDVSDIINDEIKHLTTTHLFCLG